MTSPTPRAALTLEGVVSLVAVVGGLALVVAGTRYGLSSATGIGPGTFPAAAGVLMVLSGALQLPAVARQHGEPIVEADRTPQYPGRGDPATAAPPPGTDDEPIPDRQGLIRVGVVVASTLAAGALLNRLGFIIVMGVYLAVVLKVVGHRTWLRSVLVGFLVAVLIGEGFSRLLDVSLPQSPVAFLQQLGI